MLVAFSEQRTTVCNVTDVEDEVPWAPTVQEYYREQYLLCRRGRRREVQSGMVKRSAETAISDKASFGNGFGLVMPATVTALFSST